ncbi:MAG: hypothetical protein QW272_09785 [Candidatus Methanomethylicaceae archaeon]
MLETKQKQEDYCPHCKKPLDSLIAMKNVKVFKVDDRWEAIDTEDSLRFYCPYCFIEIDINELKTKKVIF